MSDIDLTKAVEAIRPYVEAQVRAEVAAEIEAEAFALFCAAETFGWTPGQTQRHEALEHAAAIARTPKETPHA